MTFDEEQAQVKETVISLLRSTNKPGIDHLIDSLLGSNFFTARCHSHHRYSGGLARHSLGVCQLMLQNCPQGARDSLIIVGLLHDICTAKKDSWRQCGLKPNGRHGHGLRSVDIIRHCGVALTPDEEEAIRCHMHFPLTTNIYWLAIGMSDSHDASMCPGGYQHYVTPGS